VLLVVGPSKPKDVVFGLVLVDLLAALGHGPTARTPWKPTRQCQPGQVHTEAVCESQFLSISGALTLARPLSHIAYIGSATMGVKRGGGAAAVFVAPSHTVPHTAHAQ
jgi:hypothetical protein